MIRPYVTDHAVLRFCQRGCGVRCETMEDLRATGVDIDRVRRAIAAVVVDGVQVRAAAVTWCGLRFMLEDSVCVTVTPKSAPWSMDPVQTAARRAARMEMGL